MIEIHYFAWVRERIGINKETVEPDFRTVRELVESLRTRNRGYAEAFKDLASIKVAVDRELTDLDASLADAREVAFFPPMTGG